MRSSDAYGGSVTFEYDPFGRRIYKSSSSGTSVFAYDGANLIEETNSSGAAVARYEGTQNIDEPLAMLRGGTTSYYHADGLGSVTSLSSAAGSIANTYTYDSFGKLTASTGSLVNPFRTRGVSSTPKAAYITTVPDTTTRRQEDSSAKTESNSRVESTFSDMSAITQRTALTRPG